jgi:MFS family permease
VVLIGIAFGLGFSSLSLAATAGIPDQEQGLAASLFQTSFQVGGAIVLAIVTAVVDAGGASRITTAQATLGAYRPALAVITAISAIGALTALSGLLPSRRRSAAKPALALAAHADAADTDTADTETDDCGDPVCA